MFSSEIQIRVRYSETDRMGYVYYGNYAAYFELARVESIRKLGFSYKEMEDRGIMLPVLEYSIKYFKPAYYDDVLTIKTLIPQLPQARINFEYEVYNHNNDLLNKARTTLVFVDIQSKKPCSAPSSFIEALQSFFN